MNPFGKGGGGKRWSDRVRIWRGLPHGNETFEKCSILVKIKEGENYNHRNMLNISKIEI